MNFEIHINNNISLVILIGSLMVSDFTMISPALTHAKYEYLCAACNPNGKQRYLFRYTTLTRHRQCVRKLDTKTPK